MNLLAVGTKSGTARITLIRENGNDVNKVWLVNTNDASEATKTACETYLTVLEIVVTFSIWLAMRILWTMIIMITPCHDAIPAHKFLAIGTRIDRNAIASILVITRMALAIIEAR